MGKFSCLDCAQNWSVETGLNSEPPCNGWPQSFRSRHLGNVRNLHTARVAYLFFPSIEIELARSLGPPRAGAADAGTASLPWRVSSLLHALPSLDSLLHDLPGGGMGMVVDGSAALACRWLSSTLRPAVLARRWPSSKLRPAALAGRSPSSTLRPHARREAVLPASLPHRAHRKMASVLTARWALCSGQRACRQAALLATPTIALAGRWSSSTLRPRFIPSSTQYQIP
jgi:hypothetical protein